ncbi:Condensin complex subunit 2 [Phytophthora palmivora]|uniref:Condensin complex subunit 2 n=1 Tax=Phytophthora palmivora TaxID=4796 RepID=A0A2P4XE75_9STRA|nr:Condensin complex subunit 2 [Phytophthora palmivora]
MATGDEVKSDESDVEQYELTEDEEEKTQPPPDSAKRATGKRKRSLSQNDEEEIARRRRRRRSLAFQQRRRSLTPSEKKAGAATANAPPARSKQYISDMYSTIIKMSSENKINVKNSWSLHLIDHMEDILDSSKRIAADGDDDTYNFQKASCTLDASIKIYSYRVDDTWNSSYKILENLSRTEQKHGVDDAGSGGEGTTTTARKTRKTHARTIEKNLNNINLKAYDTECEADPLFHKMSQSFDEGGAKGMLLANLSVYDGCKILLNSSDVSMVTRKPIHEVAASKKEGGNQEKKSEKSEDPKAKDAAETDASDEKDNTEVDKTKTEGEEDQQLNTEKTEEDESDKKDEKDEGDTVENKSDGDVAMDEQDKKNEGSADDAEMEETEKEKEDGDVLTEEEQSKEKDESAEVEVVEDTTSKEGETSDNTEETQEEESSKPPASKERISLSLFGNLSCIDQDVQNLSVCPPLYRMYDQLDEFYGDESRHKLGIKNDFLLKTPVKGRRKTLDKQDVITMNLAGIMEGASEDESDGEDAPHDTSVDFGADNADYDADEDGGDTIGEAEEVADVETAGNMDMGKENDIIDLAGSDNEDPDDEFNRDGTESNTQALDKESSLKSTAADFFRAKVNENLPENYENNLFSQMIESALVRSATLEDEQGDDNQDSKNDYSYFDVKMLRNWAGPGHWKFPAVRKIQMKQRLQEEVDKDGLVGVNGEIDEDGVVIKSEQTQNSTDRVRKGSSAGVDKKTAITVDFFGEDPDLSRLKAPKSVSSLEISKGNLKKQEENASDLVLPVDTHIELGLFFRHFLKERPRFFRKRGGLDSAHREGALANNFEFGDTSGDTADDVDLEQPFTYNEDSAGFEGSYDDDDDGISGVDDTGTEALYSVEGLVQADRVVEKIGVHYERFAKRVDVKKLKGSIWDHLEKKVVKNDNDAEAAVEADHADSAVAINESGKRPREQEVGKKDEDDDETLETTFENVVENVAGKVPSNVTVSFYFICVLHLANEKGLELVGQDDLRDFQIRKENP